MYVYIHIHEAGEGYPVRLREKKFMLEFQLKTWNFLCWLYQNVNLSVNFFIYYSVSKFEIQAVHGLTFTLSIGNLMNK